MPNLNGYDATRRIRESEWGKDVAIFSLTGWGQAEDIQKAVAAGCTGHLVKPVDFDTLDRVLLAQIDPVRGNLARRNQQNHTLGVARTADLIRGEGTKPFPRLPSLQQVPNAHAAGERTPLYALNL